MYNIASPKSVEYLEVRSCAWWCRRQWSSRFDGYVFSSPGIHNASKTQDESDISIDNTFHVVTEMTGFGDLIWCCLPSTSWETEHHQISCPGMECLEPTRSQFSQVRCRCHSPWQFSFIVVLLVTWIFSPKIPLEFCQVHSLCRKTSRCCRQHEIKSEGPTKTSCKIVWMWQIQFFRHHPSTSLSHD